MGTRSVLGVRYLADFPSRVGGRKPPPPPSTKPGHGLRYSSGSLTKNVSTFKPILYMSDQDQVFTVTAQPLPSAGLRMTARLIHFTVEQNEFLRKVPNASELLRLLLDQFRRQAGHTDEEK